jgi:hypothetical protein
MFVFAQKREADAGDTAVQICKAALNGVRKRKAPRVLFTDRFLKKSYKTYA